MALRSSSFVAGLAGFVLITPLVVLAYLDGAEPGHTGGFGEPTCHNCHFDHPLNEPPGELAIDGLPDAYTAGSRYEVKITLSRPGLKRGGFQLAARFPSGRQAGALEAMGERVKLLEGRGEPMQYAAHTEVGNLSSSEDSISWSVRWTAPETSSEAVVFHAAANAANDDASALGDFIYTQEVILRGR